MIFYASGAINDPETLDLVLRHRIAVLTSFAYKSAFLWHVPRMAEALRASHQRLPYMIDSGAFSAWNKGREIDLHSLVDFYNAAQDAYGDVLDFTFVALDKIPGRQGVARTEQDYVEAADISIRNYEYMLRHVRGYVKPVFHDGDPERVLRAFDEAEYLSLSANQDLPYLDREAWVVRTARSLHDRRMHGLAMTGTRMLRSIRWHSVDSAAWVLWAAMGAVAWMRGNGDLMILPASQESPRRKIDGAHLGTLLPLEREEIREAMRAEGFEEELLRKESVVRARWNMLLFRRACDWAAQQPLVKPRRIGGAEGLFDA